MTTFRKKLGATMLLAAGLSGGLFSTTTQSAFAAGPKVNGGGASFPQIEIQQWVSRVAGKPFSLSVNYVPAGSTFGRTAYSDGSLDFGVSDIAFFQGEIASMPQARRSYVYVPVSAGGLAMMYNLKDNSGNPINTLKLDATQTCRTFTEPGIRWNDPAIAQLNPGIDLPNREVQPFVRADGSGTTFVMMQFCIARARDTWAKFIPLATGANAGLSSTPFGQSLPISDWPLGYGRINSQPASDGVASAVSLTDDSITYVETGFALTKGKPVAAIQNAAGIFVLPTPSAVSKALAFATPDGAGTYSLDFNGSDPGAYFPSTYSYVISQTTGFAADKGEVLGKFLCYSVTDGQNDAEKLGYAKLSAILVAGAISAISQIPGAPKNDACRNYVALVSGTAPTTTTTTKVGAATTTTPTSSGTTRPGSTATTTRAGAGATTTVGDSPTGTVATTRPGQPVVAGVTAVGSTIPGAAPGDTGGDTLPGQPAVTEDTLPGQPAVAGGVQGGVVQGGVQNTALVVSRTARRAPEQSPDNAESILWLVQGAVIFGLGRAVTKQRKLVKNAKAKL